MTRAAIDRSRVPELLAAAAADSTVWAPVSTEETGVVDLGVVAGPAGRAPALERLALEFSNTRHSVKRLFFPQTEVLLRYEGAVATEPPAAAEGPAILAFGIRPCDARSVALLDKIFAAGLTAHDDPYYTGRRARSVIVALACSAPCSSCFCTAVGGSPCGTEGADVLATDVGGDRLLFEAVSERGRDWLAARTPLLAPAGDREAAAAASAHEKAAKAVPALGTPSGAVEPDAVKARMDKAFDDPVWDRLTESCIGCGACTYLCPTCHCFDIADEDRMYHGRRIRTWDSCQYALFTKHASGHNPRPARKHRLRQRFMHKFSYTMEKSGDVYCVGCGRCVTQCPVNLDIREVIGAFSAPGA